MACCGDVPTLETLAAVELLKRHAPDVKVRVINVVDVMKLQQPSEHPHGLPDRDFDALSTTDKPIIFAYHGYPWLIHRLTYRRRGHDNIHVRGYKEEGTTTTPFDMCVLNDLDRFHLVDDVIDRVPGLAARAAYAKQAIRDKLLDHRALYPPLRRRHGRDQELDMGAGRRGSEPQARRRRTMCERGVRAQGASNPADLGNSPFEVAFRLSPNVLRRHFHRFCFASTPAVLNAGEAGRGSIDQSAIDV